jgi:uncharacterized MAPEG superfamily protein
MENTMTLALWCILAAALLPTIFVGLAKSQMKLLHNSAPRDFTASLEGWRKRARWAEQNSYESFPPFAAAVLVAHITEADPQTANILAITYIVARILYGAFYISDNGYLRTLSWALGVSCIIGLFIISA